MFNTDLLGAVMLLVLLPHWYQRVWYILQHRMM